MRIKASHGRAGKTAAAMDDSLLAKYGGPVPRYTSYPTSPHFTEAVGPEFMQGWLAALPERLPLSLYLHVPFCDTLCWFCGCHTKVVARYEPVATYLELLLAEIDLVARRLEGRRPVLHVHMGGGSPTVLTPEDHARLTAALNAAFDLQPGAEIAIEIDPRGLRQSQVETLAACGTPRASLGVQDHDPRVQQAINRIQPFETTAAAVEMLRAAGIEALNLDLRYSLPYQTEAGLRRTVSECLSLAPNRIALFGYAHVPGLKAHQRLIPEEALPGPAERWAQAEAAAEVLTEAGYRWIGLDHFARPDDPLALALGEGRLKRNFQGYTADAAPALIGFGASAISALPQGYAQNQVPVHAYAAAVRADRLATARGFILDRDDRLRRAVIERLMCDLRVDLEALSAEHGLDGGHLSPELARLAPFERDRLVERRGSEIRVTESGRALVRSVAGVFDRYLPNSVARHSQAV